MRRSGRGAAVHGSKFGVRVMGAAERHIGGDAENGASSARSGTLWGALDAVPTAARSWGPYLYRDMLVGLEAWQCHDRVGSRPRRRGWEKDVARSRKVPPVLLRFIGNVFLPLGRRGSWSCRLHCERAGAVVASGDDILDVAAGGLELGDLGVR